MQAVTESSLDEFDAVDPLTEVNTTSGRDISEVRRHL
jgi:hypothetical protein